MTRAAPGAAGGRAAERHFAIRFDAPAVYFLAIGWEDRQAALDAGGRDVSASARAWTLIDDDEGGGDEGGGDVWLS